MCARLLYAHYSVVCTSRILQHSDWLRQPFKLEAEHRFAPFGKMNVISILLQRDYFITNRGHKNLLQIVDITYVSCCLQTDRIWHSKAKVVLACYWTHGVPQPAMCTLCVPFRILSIFICNAENLPQEKCTRVPCLSPIISGDIRVFVTNSFNVRAD